MRRVVAASVSGAYSMRQASMRTVSTGRRYRRSRSTTRARQARELGVARQHRRTPRRILERRRDRDLLRSLGRGDEHPHVAPAGVVGGGEHAEAAALPRAQAGGSGERHLRARHGEQQRDGKQLRAIAVTSARPRALNVARRGPFPTRPSVDHPFGREPSAHLVTGSHPRHSVEADADSSPAVTGRPFQEPRALIRR